MSFCTAPPVSLESILYDRSTDHFRQFTAFVHSTFCTENLAFWLAVQHYHDLWHRLAGFHDGPDSSLSMLEDECCCSWTPHQDDDKHTIVTLLLPSSLDRKVSFHCRTANSNIAATTAAAPAYCDEIQEACHSILRNHIRANSPQEINIPCEMRQEILHRVEKDGNYHPAIFRLATDSVLELMRANSFIPWCSSITASAPTSPLLPPSPLNQQQQQQQQRGVGSTRQQESPLRRWWLKHQRRFGSSSSRRNSSSSDDLYLVPARPYLSAPSTPRSSGESFRNWSPWRKIHLHRW